MILMRALMMMVKRMMSIVVQVVMKSQGNVCIITKLYTIYVYHLYVSFCRGLINPTFSRVVYITFQNLINSLSEVSLCTDYQLMINCYQLHKLCLCCIIVATCIVVRLTPRHLATCI